jgi:hypothetical protein
MYVLTFWPGREAPSLAARSLLLRSVVLQPTAHGDIFQRTKLRLGESLETNGLTSQDRISLHGALPTLEKFLMSLPDIALRLLGEHLDLHCSFAFWPGTRPPTGPPVNYRRIENFRPLNPFACECDLVGCLYIRSSYSDWEI